MIYLFICACESRTCGELSHSTLGILFPLPTPRPRSRVLSAFGKGSVTCWARCLFQAYASEEVILSGGAINSPQLLMLSGVGNADDLKKLGIPVVCHLPGKFPPPLLLEGSLPNRRLIVLY